MNKAKIILSVLGVLAVIGSALAFKANKAYLGNLRCSNFTTEATTQTLPANQCLEKYYTITPVNGAIRFCTLAVDNGAVCVTKRVIANH